MTMRATRWIRLGLLGFLALGISACDYFRPAEPEPPSTSTSFLPDYSSPDSTLATIAKALADKGRTIGATAYAGALAESLSGSLPGYHQLFWPQDVADWNRIPPGDWNFTLEQTFYTRFIRVLPNAYYMEWAPDPQHPDNIGANAATMSQHYLVTAHAEDGTLTSYIAIGFADLTLLRFPDGNWRIVRWEDRRDPDANPTDTDQVTLGMRRLNSI